MIKDQYEMFEENQEKELVISADPNYNLTWGDKLVVFGKDENIEGF